MSRLLLAGLGLAALLVVQTWRMRSGDPEGRRMSAPWPRGATPTPVLEAETWDTPDHLTDHDCLAETGADQRWMRCDLDPEPDHD